MIPTTDEIDNITAEERNKLMAYCEVEQNWYSFDSRIDSDHCPNDDSLPSMQIGFQKTTRRTFNPLTQGKKKLKPRA